MIKTLKCTRENFLIGQSVLAKDETTELMDCHNAEEYKNAAVETNTFVVYGRFCFC
jgi:hypothetical protein